MHGPCKLVVRMDLHDEHNRVAQYFRQMLLEYESSRKHMLDPFCPNAGRLEFESGVTLEYSALCSIEFGGMNCLSDSMFPVDLTITYYPKEKKKDQVMSINTGNAKDLPITIDFTVSGEQNIKNLWDKLKEVALGTHEKGTLHLPEFGAAIAYRRITGCSIDRMDHVLTSEGQPTQAKVGITYIPAV